MPVNVVFVNICPKHRAGRKISHVLRLKRTDFANGAETCRRRAGKHFRHWNAVVADGERIFPDAPKREREKFRQRRFPVRSRNRRQPQASVRPYKKRRLRFPRQALNRRQNSLPEKCREIRLTKAKQSRALSHFPPRMISGKPRTEHRQIMLARLRHIKTRSRALCLPIVNF